MTAYLPFFELGSIDLGPLELQWFGILVATGVLLGAGLARRYGDKFAILDDDIRGMTGWTVVCGFIGAHVFDVLAYQQDDLQRDPLLLLKLWKGISSYGGFIGGAIGWWIFQWWKRLQTGLWADITVLGLLLGFTLGRVGCSVVHDHIGRATDFVLGVDYPRSEIVGRLCAEGREANCEPWLRDLFLADPDKVHRLWNLGMMELLYLIPVNLLIIGLAFKKKPLPAGLLAVLTGLLYAPVRFFLEYLRPNETDPRYAGLTFAQWMSIVAFAAAAYFFVYLLRKGKPAPLASELGPKEVGGRRDRGPKLTKKDLKGK